MKATPFPQIEEKIMKQWIKNKTFQKSIAQRDKKNSYVFYDGPPFATGLPHYGHIVASAMKDVVPRFWTMNGKRVERQWGWDCHGLPIENIVEKELKLNSRKDIEKLGVDKFNEACRSKVLLYADEWKKIITRLGRWADMDNDYKTMDPDFMESVWWAFKSLWDKKLIYEGRKSMHLCPRCETTLSNMEVGMGYKDTKDLSVTAKFELEDEPGTYVLSWTTTPWTLPGNVALAVGRDLDYIELELDKYVFAKNTKAIVKERQKEKYIISKDVFESLSSRNDKDPLKLAFGLVDLVNVGTNKIRIKKMEIRKGKELAGKKYKPLFDYYVNADVPNKENFFKIVTADFVSTEEGTGIVHIAPGFGEDDMMAGEKNNLPFIQHVGSDGRFTEEVKDFAGLEVKPKEDPMETDVKILKYLNEKGLVFAKEKYEHSYPFCWRCDSPLLNYTTSSWFVKVTDLKDKMLKLAKQINWVPDHLKEGRFGKWLEGARDWAISRSRYWGTPLPVWRCDCGEIKVIGSLQELKKESGQDIQDLHKHFVDKIKIPCLKCSAKMKRIPEVLDCWFESGSMPYGQKHYPFEDKKEFENNFPAEYIAEGVDQCRAWFYVLHVLGTALFDKPAYKNVVVNGIVLAEDGHKMSKKLNNYPDPMKVINKYGADALRYYLTSSSVMKAEDLNFSEKGVDEVYKKVVLILLNVLSFYQMFANKKVTSNEQRVTSNNILDKWILARLNQLIKEVTEKMEAYDMPRALKPIGDFIHDLSTWYIRRSRDRFKNKETQTEEVTTLNQVLEKLSLTMAPFMPYLSEHVWQNLGNKESVHLQKWPKAEKIDQKLLTEMAEARKIVELGLAARDEAQVKVRQPLQSIKYGDKELDSELAQVMAEELNVKEVKFEKTLKDKVELDTNLTEELEIEGLLRELTRAINGLRKEAGLSINDQAKLSYQTSGKLLLKLFADKNLVEKLKQATLLKELKGGKGGREIKVNEETIFLLLK